MLFLCSFSALEYHNLNTSIATRDFWVITGNCLIVSLLMGLLKRSSLVELLIRVLYMLSFVLVLTHYSRGNGPVWIGPN